MSVLLLEVKKKKKIRIILLSRYTVYHRTGVLYSSSVGKSINLHERFYSESVPCNFSELVVRRNHHVQNYIKIIITG